MTKLQEIAYAMGLLEVRDGKTWNCGGHDFGTNDYEIYWEDETHEDQEAILFVNIESGASVYITESLIEVLLTKIETLNISLDRTKIPKPKRDKVAVVFSYTDDLTFIQYELEDEFAWICINAKRDYPILAKFYGTTTKEALDMAESFAKSMQKSCIVN